MGFQHLSCGCFQAVVERTYARATWRGHQEQVVAAEISVGDSESSSPPPGARWSGLPLRELVQVTSSLSSPKAWLLPLPPFPHLFLIPEPDRWVPTPAVPLRTLCGSLLPKPSDFLLLTPVPLTCPGHLTLVTHPSLLSLSLSFCSMSFPSSSSPPYQPLLTFLLPCGFLL